MKRTLPINVGIAGLMVAAANATITIDNIEPSTDVLYDGIVGGTINTIIDTTDNPGARGGGFEIPSSLGSEFAISGITLDANTNTLAEGFAFIVSIFVGDPYGQTFTAPGGNNQTDVNSASFATAVGATLVGEEVFAVGAGGVTTAAADFITFDFTNDILVDADTDLIVFVSTNDEFNQREGTGNANNAANPTINSRIQFRGNTTSTPEADASSRDLRFSVLGTAVPEPSSAALLGLSGLALLLRRRK